MLLLGGLLGALVTLVGVGVAESFAEDFAADVTTYGSGGDLAVFSIGAGQCARQDVFEAHTYPEGSAVSCDENHAIENYAEVEPPTVSGDVGGFLTHDLANFADAACYLAFEPYVGLDYDSSDFDYLAIVPSADAWDEGARTVHCVLFEYDGSTSSGTANGSAR